MMARKKDPDAHIRELIESGDKEDLARALIAPVLGILLRRTDDEDEAIESLPEAVSSVVSARRRYKTGMSVRGWILTVITAKHEGEKPASSWPEALPRGDSVDELAEADGIVEDVEGMLSVLNEEQREALELLAVERLSPSEAEGALKEPAAVIEQRAERALAEVAARIASMGD